MKTASRFMPSKVFNRYSFGDAIGTTIFYMFVCCFLCLFIAPAFNIPLLWAEIVILLITVFIVLSLISYDLKKHKIFNSRPNDDIGTFTKDLNYRELDTWVIRATYEEISEYMKIKGKPFPIRPSDKLYLDLGLSCDNLHDMVDNITSRIGRELELIEDIDDLIEHEKFEENEDNDNSPLHYTGACTVEDLIMYINKQPKI